MCGVTRDITEKKNESWMFRNTKYLEALDAAAGILLHSMSEIKYEDFLAVLGKAADVDRAIIILKTKMASSCKNSGTMGPKCSYCCRRPQGAFIQNIWPKWEKILSRTNLYTCWHSECKFDKEKKYWDSLSVKALLVLPI